jgi:hypothetical protein
LGERPQALAALVAVLCAVPLAAGCESTQTTSARLAKQADTALHQKGLRVTKPTRTVKVERRAVLQDANGAAVVVELRNRTRKLLAAPAVAIDVQGAGGKSVFRNDAPGLEDSLTGPAVLKAGEDFFWVHDQVFARGAKVRRVAVKVGAARRKAPRELPRLVVTRPRLEGDPTSGILAAGFVFNRSKVEQRQLVLYAVARKGRRIVAAGRGQIKRLKAGKRGSYQIFFIGNPRGARLEVAAPPTSFE